MRSSTIMRLEDFNYGLPEKLIAQRPPSERGASRMLVLDARSGNCEIRRFVDLPDYLGPGDCAVFNNSKVIKARFFGNKEKSGARIEILLLKPVPDSSGLQWECFAKPGKRVKPGTVVTPFAPDGTPSPETPLNCDGRNEDGVFTFSFPDGVCVEDLIARLGHVPLPPYIKRPDESSDSDRYQTVFAKENGSVAAPTAGLHFTQEVMQRIESKGVVKAELTLHVGPGTFLPVAVEDISSHKMHSECYCLPEEEAEKIRNAKKDGGKILAVGTTSVRTLETCADEQVFLRSGSGETRIFLRPPYVPKIPDLLLTNFHLPKSSLLMLVCCFAERDLVLGAYRKAIEEEMMFFSYGDCMLLVR